MMRASILLVIPLSRLIMFEGFLFGSCSVVVVVFSFACLMPFFVSHYIYPFLSSALVLGKACLEGGVWWIFIMRFE
jgi:hypothetical protein